MILWSVGLLEYDVQLKYELLVAANRQGLYLRADLFVKTFRVKTYDICVDIYLNSKVLHFKMQNKL